MIVLHSEKGFEIVLSPVGSKYRADGLCFKASSNLDTCALTASDWIRVIERFFQLPEAKDPNGGKCVMRSRSEGNDLDALGDTYGRRGTWNVSLTPVGQDPAGNTLFALMHNQDFGPPGLTLVEWGYAFWSLLDDLKAL